MKLPAIRWLYGLSLVSASWTRWHLSGASGLTLCGRKEGRHPSRRSVKRKDICAGCRAVASKTRDAPPRARARARAPITHETVKAATERFEAGGGLIEKIELQQTLPARTAIPYFGGEVGLRRYDPRNLRH